MKKILTLILLVAGTMSHAEELPERWIYSPEHLPMSPDVDGWQSLMNDPQLDSLMVLASEANYDIKEAATRRSIAANSIRQARAAYLPELNVSAGFTHAREQAVSSNRYNIGADMSWEIDIFGRVSSAVKQKKATYRASAAELQGAKLSVAAEMANYYVNLRLLQARIAMTEEHVARQKKVVSIAEARHEAGLVSKLDVTQARTVLHTTEATLPPLRSELRSTMTAIAALLGTYPDSIPLDLTTPAPLPSARIPAPGVPADLIRRRPDIIAAEAQLAASAAAVGIAKKDFLPVLSLEGSIATAAAKPGDLLTGRSISYSIAPTLSWTAFDGLSRRYGLEQARLEMENEINNYNLTVINAVGEVDNAFASYLSAEETARINEQLITEAEESLTLSLDLYKQGLTAFTNVVDAQVSLLSAANAQLTARGNSLIAIINLYKALGGTPTE